MTDIVERLRQPWPPSNSEDPLMTEAADEIERLRAALREIAYFEISSNVGDIYGDTQKEWLEAFDRSQSIARAALKEGK